jgi:hypothetical protein
MGHSIVIATFVHLDSPAWTDTLVMRGLDPRIHLFRVTDCRVKPGNDSLG